jgi:hypothetical protein
VDWPSKRLLIWGAAAALSVNVLVLIGNALPEIDASSRSPLADRTLPEVTCTAVPVAPKTSVVDVGSGDMPTRDDAVTNTDMGVPLLIPGAVSCTRALLDTGLALAFGVRLGIIGVFFGQSRQEVSKGEPA